MRFGLLCASLGIRMVAGGGGEGISIWPKGLFEGLLVAFLLKKPACYVEISFPHYVKVLFQIEILYLHYVKVLFQIEILYLHYIKVLFQIEILYLHYVKAQFQIEISFSHYVKA